MTKMLLTDYTPDGKPVYIERSVESRESRKAAALALIRGAIEAHLKDNGMVTAPDRLAARIVDELFP